MYLDAKQKVALAAKTEEENVRLKHRISQLDENAIAREKGRTATAERKAQEQATRANREEQRANKAENRLSMMERFVRQAGASEAFDRWANLTAVIDKAIAAFKLKWQKRPLVQSLSSCGTQLCFVSANWLLKWACQWEDNPLEVATAMPTS